MKMFRKFMSAAFLIGSCLAAFTACSSSDELGSTAQPNKDGLHTITMKLVGGCEQYDAKGTTRAGESTVSWKDGDKLYLQFTVGDKLVAGNATYSSASNAWTVSYYGSLATDASAKCQAYYFENTTAGNGDVVQLTDRSAIYEDVNGTYLFDGDNLTVKASLKPKTGRMRFSGTKGTPIVVTGITHYASYDASSNSFFTTTSVVKDTVDNTTGYTPYIYGYFTDTTSPSIGLVANSSEAYTMTCPITMYKTGESGYLSVPTETSHNGWATGLNFTVNGVSFKMIPVEYAKESFLIGETELTEGLYFALMDGTTTCPLKAVDKSYSSFETFLTKLNAATSMNFRFPTAAEWKFAAKGGMKSLNFKYSGSNTPNDVAWYSGNASAVQNVKLKQPNELGIYDMSGNLWEWVSDLAYYSYSASHYIYGGSYKSNISNIVSEGTPFSSYYESDYNSYATGLRLALTLN